MWAKRIGLFVLVLTLFLVGLQAWRRPRQTATFNLQVDNGLMGTFNGQAVLPPPIDLAAAEPDSNILGETDVTGEKQIFVDLSTQTLTAYQGETLFLKTLVSTGKWAPTPTGEFKIWTKFRATKMSGGSGNDYYYLPNVPYTMFFSGSGVAPSRGFALHGTYWHNNFGHPMSHGCVNLRTVDAEKLFYWTDGSEKIIIYGQTPG